MLGSSLAAIALAMAPVSLRFDYAPLNYIAVMALALLPPFSLCWLALRIRARGWQAGMTGLALLTWLPALAFVFMASFPLRTALNQGEMADETPIASLRSGGDHYQLYRISGGAHSSWSVLLRRETALLPGLKLVRDVLRQGHTYSAYICEAPGQHGGVALSQDPCNSVNQY